MRSYGFIAVFLGLFLAFGFMQVRADQIELQKGKSTPTPTQNRSASTPLPSTKRPVLNEFPEKTIYISGFFIDISHVDRPLKFFSLRQPNREKEDLSNLFTDVKTGRFMGVKLLSIDF